MRSSRIFVGRNGSAIDGRAAPMKSRMPLRICRTIVSGDVNLPTLTTGLLVMRLTYAIRSSSEASLANREVAISSP